MQENDIGECSICGGQTNLRLLMCSFYEYACIRKFVKSSDLAMHNFICRKCVKSFVRRKEAESERR